ncbi:MAG: hypothetical protein RSD44_03820 [Akkermansia sp.]
MKNNRSNGGQLGNHSTFSTKLKIICKEAEAEAEAEAMAMGK